MQIKTRSNLILSFAIVGITFLATLVVVVGFLSPSNLFVADSGFSSGGKSMPDPSACVGHSACRKVGDTFSLSGGDKCACERTTGSLCRCKVIPKQNPAVTCPNDEATSPACRGAVVNSTTEYTPGRTCTCQLNGSQCGCVPTVKQQVGESCTDNSECGTSKCVDKICIQSDNTCTSGDSVCVGKEFNTCMSQDAGDVNYRCVSSEGRKCSRVLDNSCGENQLNPNTSVDIGPFNPPSNIITDLVSIESTTPMYCTYGKFDLLKAREGLCKSDQVFGRVCGIITDPETGKTSVNWITKCFETNNPSAPEPQPAAVLLAHHNQECNSVRACGNGLVCEDDPNEPSKKKFCFIEKGSFCDTINGGNRRCGSGLSCSLDSVHNIGLCSDAK